MDGIKRVSTKGVTAKHASSVDHRRVQKSSTLNRRFVKKPTVAPKISTVAGAASVSLRQMSQRKELLQKQHQVQLHPTNDITRTSGTARQSAQQPVRIVAANQQTKQIQNQQQQRAARMQEIRQAASQEYTKLSRTQQQDDIAEKRQMITSGQLQQHHIAKIAKARMAARKAEPERLSAQELKDRAIQQALRKVSTMNETQTQFGEAVQKKTHFWQNKKFAIASSMAVISIALLGYLVYLNLPDLSVRVAAMQTGIDNAYPSYVPTDYRLDGLVSENNGCLTMAFKNDDGEKFTLKEEKTTWDSSAVLSNYVKKEWGDDYSIAKGQGLTIYVSKSNAAWVNGGVFYVIENESGKLTSSDLHDIAVSL